MQQIFIKMLIRLNEKINEKNLRIKKYIQINIKKYVQNDKF